MTKQITDGHKLYALCFRNHAYYIVGPFESYDTLTVWGDHEEQHGDDPRWQSIELCGDGDLLPVAHGPDWHPGYTP